jgi:hypothetical protein
MSSGPKLDGAGLAKIGTLEEAGAAVQRIHGIVERMALAIRSRQDTTQFGGQIRRAASPLVGLLKGQFGMIADQVAALVLVATRPGGDQVRLRSLREAVAQLKIQLEIAVTKTREKHTVPEEPEVP